MVAGTYTLIIEANATLAKIFQLLDENSNPIDITVYDTWDGSIRESFTGSVLGSLTVALSDAVNGKISVDMTDADTLALQDAVTFDDGSDVWEGVYDIFGKDTGGAKLKPVKGKVQLHRAVTTT